MVNNFSFLYRSIDDFLDLSNKGGSVVSNNTNILCTQIALSQRMQTGFKAVSGENKYNCNYCKVGIFELHWSPFSGWFSHRAFLTNLFAAAVSSLAAEIKNQDTYM